MAKHTVLHEGQPINPRKGVVVLLHFDHSIDILQNASLQIHIPPEIALRAHGNIVVIGDDSTGKLVVTKNNGDFEAWWDETFERGEPPPCE